MCFCNRIFAVIATIVFILLVLACGATAGGLYSVYLSREVTKWPTGAAAGAGAALVLLITLYLISKALDFVCCGLLCWCWRSKTEKDDDDGGNDDDYDQHLSTKGKKKSTITPTKKVNNSRATTAKTSGNIRLQTRFDIGDESVSAFDK